jgi:putative aminopeptidase FrvX
LTLGEFLKAVTEAPGPSGYEEEVRQIVRSAFSPYCDELRVDPMGNVWAVRRATRRADRAPRIMLAAHMDEIGFVVKKIDAHVLRVSQVGGFDVRILPGQPVLVHGKVPLPGVIGSRPPHVLPPDEREKVIPLDELFVDVGLTAEELPRYVRVGDLITLRRGYVELRNGLVMSKALDDRAGVAALYSCLQELQALQHSWDVFAVATTQEEVGLRGAMTSAYGVAPDAAIAVDVTFGRTPDCPDIGTFELDKGPCIARGPNIHPVMFSLLEETAKRLEIPYQTEPIPGRSGTDAWAIQVAREGVPTGLVGLPLRYMHTPGEVVCLRDIERAGRLLAHLVATLDERVLSRFRAPLGSSS